NVGTNKILCFNATITADGVGINKVIATGYSPDLGRGVSDIDEEVEVTVSPRRAWGYSLSFLRSFLLFIYSFFQQIKLQIHHLIVR
ncbi:hypothetical protein DRZ77_01790, partial [Candidatus Woesearchaeota archaeon]